MFNFVEKKFHPDTSDPNTYGYIPTCDERINESWANSA